MAFPFLLVKFEMQRGQVITNPRGIPKAHFVDNVDDFMFAQKSADDVIKEFEEQYRKYKFMEMNTQQRKRQLATKTPEIIATLETIDYLISKKQENEGIETCFELSDTLYAKATINSKDKVYLWLGANVMLEYTLDEAKELLLKNKDSAEKNLVILNEDLDFLSEQIVTLEVNIARIHNWSVKQRKLKSHK